MQGRKNLIPILFMLFFCQQPLKAQLAGKYKGYSENHYKSLRYGLFKPANYEAGTSYPMIVYLHGSRDTVSRDISWYHESIQNKHPCFVLTPKCEVADQGWGNTWHQGYTSATAKTLELVDSLSRIYNIDTNRLYLYGISMGGFGVFSILAKEKEKFAAAYAVCGGSDVKAAAKILQTPLWIFHGEVDDIVPVSLSSNVYKEIVRLGGKKVRYTEYAGVKHNSWENVSREKTLSKWLFSQSKGSTGGRPDPVIGLSIEQQNKNVRLTWTGPSNPTQADQEVWYYKVFRDDVVVGEIEGDVLAYVDSNHEINSTSRYSVVAVNYFFNESKPSQSLKVSMPHK
jgi:poly(3-hydroxybutyrate) depolymerase